KQYLGAKADPAPTLIAAFPGWQYARGHETLILSRFPLRERAERPLGPFRNCLTCRMRLGDRSVRLINVHLNTALHGESLQTDSLNFRRYLPETARVRKTQVEALMRIIEESAGPCIVAGDFNSPPNSFVHQAMTQRFHDCFEQAGRGWGLTYRADLGLWRIDYLFLSSEFAVAHCKVGSTRVSDHRPVWGEVYLP
ncbi:MAG: endonuclease/exonuclease/phosphatase family protein, partial [Armatimonadetes bacterium]|nr:endonuclease/exonuclease/phosphatase family protein [Armatimonadota bacterium]